MTHTTDSSTEPTIGQLVAHATADLSQLVRSEIALAKVELKKEAVNAGLGAGLLGGAGFSGVLGLIFLSIAVAYGIHGLGAPLGVGFLIVGVLYVLAALVMALLGRRSLKKVGPPQKTLATVKDDVAWAKHPTQAPARS